MFDQARSVISTSLAIGAVLLVLWTVGIVSSPGTRGMAAVGAGIGAVFRAGTDMISHVRF